MKKDRLGIKITAPRRQWQRLLHEMEWLVNLEKHSGSPMAKQLRSSSPTCTR